MIRLGLANYNFRHPIPDTIKTNGDLISFKELIGRSDYHVGFVNEKTKPTIMNIFTKKSILTNIVTDNEPSENISNIAELLQ